MVSSPCDLVAERERYLCARVAKRGGEPTPSPSPKGKGDCFNGYKVLPFTGEELCSIECPEWTFIEQTNLG